MSGWSYSSVFLTFPVHWKTNVQLSLLIATVWSGPLLVSNILCWQYPVILYACIEVPVRLAGVHRLIWALSAYKPLFSCWLRFKYFFYVYVYHIYRKYSHTTTPCHTCSKIWTSTIYYLILCIINAGWVANSIDPDETPRSAASHQDLHSGLSVRMHTVNTVLWKYMRLTITTLWANSADDKLIFFFLSFFSENRHWHFMQMVICIKCQHQFSGKNKKKNKNVVCWNFTQHAKC